MAPAGREPDHDRGRIRRGLGQTARGWLDEHRLGHDARQALHRHRCVGEQAARIALRAARPRESQRLARRRRQPGAELDRRPVVLPAAERNDHAAAVARAGPAGDDGDVRRAARQQLDQRRPAAAPPAANPGGASTSTSRAS